MITVASPGAGAVIMGWSVSTFVDMTWRGCPQAGDHASQGRRLITEAERMPAIDLLDLRKLVEDQCGVLSRRQALAAGGTPAVVERRLKTDCRGGVRFGGGY